jgi:type IV pilus assembly protein PilN
MDINLLPWREEIIRYNKKIFLRLVLLSLVASTIFLVFAYRMIFAELSYVKSYTSALESAKLNLVGSVNAYMAQKKVQKEMDARIVTLQKFQDDRFSTVRLLNAMVTTVPKGIYLTKLVRNNNQIDIAGVANSNLLIANLMQVVEASPHLKVESLQKVEKTVANDMTVTQFELKLNLITTPVSVKTSSS